MDILKLLRFRSPPSTDQTTGRWILAGLFVLGVLALAGCGTSTSPSAVLEAYTEAVKAGEIDAALALFTDDAVIVDPGGRRFPGKNSIRQYVYGEVKWWAEGHGCSELFNVQETEDTLDADERCDLQASVWEGHHTITVENGKIKSWTQSGKEVE